METSEVEMELELQQGVIGPKGAFLPTVPGVLKEKKANHRESLTNRSNILLTKEGYIVDLVEHWNYFAHKKKDLFGFIDLLAVRNGITLAVQVTSSSNVSARLHKIQDSPYLDKLLEAHWRIQVHGWYRPDKNNHKWRVKILEINGREGYTSPGAR